MTVRNLQYLFEPGSVAVVGASNRPRSVGWAVMRNVLTNGFDGPVMPVNPRHRAVAGVLAYPSVASLPLTPDLAVVCTPPPTVPEVVADLAEKGARCAIVITAGLSRERLPDGRTLEQAMLDAARPQGMRILGPNCVGLIAPHHALNASFAHIGALPGDIALVQQSGALGTAMLDWTRSANIGLSHFVSVGDSADVHFGDLLDYLGGEPSARAICLYIESIRNARVFMSAARAAARTKPVLVVKAGRVEEGARAAASHTGALAGTDAVYDAAFERAGMLRVITTAQMFDAVATLAHVRELAGDHLAILTNGGGPGVLATDALISEGGSLASLRPETLEQLAACLPETWSEANPVDIIGDAGRARYAASMAALLGDEGVGAILAIHAPTDTVDCEEAARGVIEAVAEKRSGKVVLACWMGGDTMAGARRMFSDAGIATYDTPENAARAFIYMTRYARNQELLMETPPSVPEEFHPATDAARLVIQSALLDGREMLTEPESKSVLSAYGVPVVETRIARDADDAVRAAESLGFPVAVKLLCAAVSHKSDVGGVVLDVTNADDVRAAVEGMTGRVREHLPDATIAGYTVQAMARRPGAFELIVGTTLDPVFGPVVLFGEGGTGVEVINDQAVALPPLNMKLAAELISRTRVSRRLAGYRDRRRADQTGIALALLRVSQLVTDVPEIVELDVNPLIADWSGVLALDARIRITRASAKGADRLAVRPYPSELEETIEIAGERVVLRPIRPEDEQAHREFLEAMDPEDIRFRFFGIVRKFPHSQLARFTQIDYDREMAFVAKYADPERRNTLGVVRAVADPDNDNAEFAIIIDSKLHGHGLGVALLEKIIRYAAARGTRVLVGEVLRDNRPMRGLARRLGFVERAIPEDDAVHVELDLARWAAEDARRSRRPYGGRS